MLYHELFNPIKYFDPDKTILQLNEDIEELLKIGIPNDVNDPESQLNKTKARLRWVKWCKRRWTGA